MKTESLANKFNDSVVFTLYITLLISELELTWQSTGLSARPSAGSCGTILFLRQIFDIMEKASVISFRSVFRGLFAICHSSGEVYWSDIYFLHHIDVGAYSSFRNLVKIAFVTLHNLVVIQPLLSLFPQFCSQIFSREILWILSWWY